MRVVLATGNQGKAREFQQRLGDWMTIVSQAELGIASPEESGLSFVENAIIKARHAAQASGLPALADDSGLCVDALQGAPGIYSARYAGEQATDEENNRLLLQELASHSQRSAHFVCVLALVRHSQDPQPLICEADWRGSILPETKGENGFGYDPLFQPDGLECTSAQLEPEEKNRISHRGRAISLLLKRLETGI